MPLRIGNGCGFWGDNLDAPILLAKDGNLDYLTLEYLAELTMSILAVQKQRDPEAGFASDFLDVLDRLVPILKDQPRPKIITNAGGMNPQACARKAASILAKAGLARRVATVSGDDLLPHLDDLLRAGHPLTNLDTGDTLETIRPQVVSANAYLGARPIVDALAKGADVVITGRIADASLTVGPLVHELQWPWDDWRRLSAATVAGHLIECGAQATGGLWCNYSEAIDLANVGYPIVEVEPDGRFTITKPPNTGGAVNVETVAEQLLYEVGDPAAYLTPDVVADFTSVQLTQSGADRVQVVTGNGKPATATYKVSIAYRNGYSASGMLVLIGPDAADKARLCGEIIRERLRRVGLELANFNVETIGKGACVPDVLASAPEPAEVVLRVTVRDPRRAAVERFTKEFAPLVTSGPPGVTGYTTGRPPVREVFAYWPALLKKTEVVPNVEVIST
ncbi:MAG: DUF1446 domain-containing protein [Planctomycetes bacterium]|nr:DUF1446 domain-containing protein [Planctomycetota bacterium]